MLRSAPALLVALAALTGCPAPSAKRTARSVVLTNTQRSPAELAAALQARLLAENPPWKDPVASGILLHRDREGPFEILHVRDVSSPTLRFELSVLFGYRAGPPGQRPVVAVLRYYSYSPQDGSYLGEEPVVAALASQILNHVVKLED